MPDPNEAQERGMEHELQRRLTRPWYAQKSAKLKPDEIDDYDRRVPGRVKRGGSLFR